MNTEKRPIFASALAAVRSGMVTAMMASGIISILMLAGPIFMLQVYDRVLTGRSTSTLVALLIILVASYAIMAILDFLRMRILSRIAHNIDLRVAPALFDNWLRQPVQAEQAGVRPLTEMQVLRGFIGSPAFVTLFELPWFPIYLLVVFMLHVQLGLLASAGAAVVIVLSILNEYLTAKPLQEGAALEGAEIRFGDESRRNADSIIAMGMTPAVRNVWDDMHRDALSRTQGAAGKAEFLSASSRAFRMLLQSAILGLGAYLAIGNEISAGAIVAASILGGRALAPIDQFLGAWRQVGRARLAYKRLQTILARTPETPDQPMTMPAPRGLVQVDGLTLLAIQPAARAKGELILSNISFSLNPGEGLGVIGPSASGKSSLARLLVGLWSPDRGAVRLDGATFEQWGHDQVGRYIGYLPQNHDLIAGTIRQNIARFDPTASDEDVQAAAKFVGVHEMILAMPRGYETDADAAGGPLTGGQRQRIALARAVFRLPKLVVLDEPNSNLDADGEMALANAIAGLRRAGSTVVVMAHRPSAIAAVNKLLILKDGKVVDFGEKADVLKRNTRAA